MASTMTNLITSATFAATVTLPMLGARGDARTPMAWLTS